MCWVSQKKSDGARLLEGKSIRSRYKFGMVDESVNLGHVELRSGALYAMIVHSGS
jgi:hypothetical protein